MMLECDLELFGREPLFANASKSMYSLTHDARIHRIM